ncbi:DUF6463 family protein [Nocardiopsis coralliicola]
MDNATQDRDGAAAVRPHARDRWVLAGGWSVIAIAALHTAVFAGHPYWAEWFSGGLRGGGEPDSVAVFWALPAFVGPVALLGVLLVGAGRRGVAVPGWIGAALAVWALGCAALVGPSGFLLCLVPAALLAAGAWRRTRR